MRKDDRLLRKEVFLPPPSINSHRPVASEEELEKRAIAAFSLAVLVAGVVGFMMSSVLYGTGLWAVASLLEVGDWKPAWLRCVLSAGVFLFVRSFDRANRTK